MRKILSLVFLCLLLCTGAAFAQTGDGETPAEETVCDDYQGAAFGACNAYCEALDCDSDDPGGSPRACSRLYDRFVDLTGETPPCEVCPCANVSNLWNVAVHGEAIDSNGCFFDLDLPAAVAFSAFEDAETGNFDVGILGTGPQGLFGADCEGEFCCFGDSFVNGEFGVLAITANENNRCIEQLIEAHPDGFCDDATP